MKESLKMSTDQFPYFVGKIFGKSGEHWTILVPTYFKSLLYLYPYKHSLQVSQFLTQKPVLANNG